MDKIANDKAVRRVGLVRHLCERFGLDPEAADGLVADYPYVLEGAGTDYEAMVGALAQAALLRNVQTKAALRDAARRAADPDTSDVETPHPPAKATDPSKVMYEAAGAEFDARISTDPVAW